ncbi:AAA family ATPase [Deinococcus misasensis]|uniref:AAA family ATPase n=1 Tax=Deinococcus misasensis TaxID=392413 RepID=UPI0005505B8C|nr:SMC family ATPase [Deinococcus misasensis]
MKPLKLTLQNFTCFREHTEVDFSELSLYAIQGQTGSGKSSLLDAICFALYGETPRLGAKGLDALISQGAQSLSVRFEFEVGQERFEVARSKGRKASESETRLSRIQDGKAVTAVEGNKKKDIQSEIEKVVGLSFDSFTRAILLPQGQFDRFLKGNSREKQELLGKLIGLDRFTRMQKVASEKARSARTQHDLLQHRLDTEFAEVTDERLKELATQLDTTLHTLQEQEQQQTQLSEALVVQEELAALHQQETRHQRDMQTLLSSQPAMEKLEQQVQAALEVAGVLTLIRTTTSLQEKWQQAKLNHQKSQQAHQQATLKLQEAEKAYQQARGQALQVPELESQMSALQDAQGLYARLKQLGGQLKASPVVLPWSEDAYAQARNMVELKAQLEAEALQIGQEQQRIQQQKQQLLKEQKEQQRLRDLMEQLIPQGKEARTEVERLKTLLETSRVQHQALHLKAHLKVGEPCPVCEQQVRSLPVHVPQDITALEKQVKQAEKHLETIVENYQNAKNQLHAVTARMQQGQEFLTERETELKKRQQGFQAKQGGLTTSDPQQQMQALLSGLAQTILQKSGGDDPEKRFKALQQEKARFQQMEQNSYRLLSAAESQTSALKAQLDLQSQQVTEREQEWQEAHRGLQEALSTLAMTQEEALACAMTPEQMQEARQKVQQWRTRLAGVQAQLQEVQEKKAGREYQPELHLQQKSALQTLTVSLKGLSVQVGQLQSQQSHLKEKLDLKRTLVKEAALHQKTLNTWDALAKNLQLDRFPKFLLEEVEEQLLIGAGALLTDISDGRYALHLQDGEYVVSDHWNAGETRPIRTLSGGETFLASLSLAIALSDYLAGNKLLGALFLDEGFGTLDPQALDAVARALEKLQISGRMVGVITHVPALAARLPARVLVEKRMSGSFVRIDSEEISA